MAFHRLYTGSDGHSHIEEMDLSSHPTLTTLHETKGIVFRSAEPGRFSDWHNAPRLQYVIVLGGRMEIGVGDGTKRILDPGDILQVEDLTGQGHTTRSIGQRVVASVPLVPR